MNIHFTLDYELFFGTSSGTVENCMIKPTNELLELLKPHNIKATFYVDVGYIECAGRLNCDNENVEKVVKQLQQLNNEGHDLQLHIHPHWDDANYVDGKWLFDMSRYRLADFSKHEAASIIKRYVAVFGELNLPKPVAYRAGGWCIQPFEHIADALYENGIRVDSTVYNGGKNRSKTHFFDFTKSPKLNDWRFNNNPCKAVHNGRFYELPISHIHVQPLFFWQFAFAKKLGSEQHKAYGDGSAVAMSKLQMMKLLLFPSSSVASIDGYKAKLMKKAEGNQLRQLGQNSDLVFIGHPKVFSDYSLKQVKYFLQQSSSVKFLTTSDWLKQKQTRID